jgi:ATP-dependent Clp protease ATP-binding subunit ClpC
VRGFIARLRGALGDRFDTFSPDAKQALQRAAAEARLGGQPTITAEQVLLAAATEPDAPAARALAALGFDADLLRARAEPVLGRRGQRNAPPAAGPGLALDAGAKRLIEAAVAVENQRHDGHVGTEHLLLGALELAERSPSVGRALPTAWDVDPAALRTAIEQQLPV